MHCPCVHHRAALFQQVSAVISSFNSVRHSMRERAFGKVAGVSVFTGPIAEAAAKAVSRCYAFGRVAFRFYAAQERREHHVTEYLPTRRRKDKRFVKLLFLQRLNQFE